MSLSLKSIIKYLARDIKFSCTPHPPRQARTIQKSEYNESIFPSTQCKHHPHTTSHTTYFRHSTHVSSRHRNILRICCLQNLFCQILHTYYRFYRFFQVADLARQYFHISSLYVLGILIPTLLFAKVELNYI